MSSVVYQSLSVINSLINRVLNTSDTSILDPLSVAIRLSLLCYKPRKTKISIGRSTRFAIEYDEPDAQGIQRRVKGSTRNDIASLNTPIQIAIHLYNFENPFVAYIFEKASDGLKELLSCYDHTHDTVCEAIQLYRGILNNELAKVKLQKVSLSNSGTNSSASVISLANSETVYQTNTNEKILCQFNHIEVFKILWTPRNVHIIYLLLQELESQFLHYNSREVTKDLISPSVIRAIGELVDVKDAILEHRIGEKHMQDIVSDVNRISIEQKEETMNKPAPEIENKIVENKLVESKAVDSKTSEKNSLLLKKK